MPDLKNPSVIYFKGILFLLGCLIASGLILFEHPDVRTAGLLAIAIWCAARFYYFLFYVIEHYVDRQFRFAGICSFVMYLVQKKVPADQSKPPA